MGGIPDDGTVTHSAPIVDFLNDAFMKATDLRSRPVLSATAFNSSRSYIFIQLDSVEATHAMLQFDGIKYKGICL